MATVQFSVRLPVDLKAQLEAIGASEDRTLTKVIELACKQYVRLRDEMGRASRVGYAPAFPDISAPRGKDCPEDLDSAVTPKAASKQRA